MVVGERKPAAKIRKRDGEDDESLLKEWVGLLGRAGCWALLIYLFIFQVSVVDGPSMQATFEPGDRLVIDKLSYRFSSVQRFDVIVFEAIDRANSPRMSRDYIKRVIGLPGDHGVEIHGDFDVWIRESADGPLRYENFTESLDPTRCAGTSLPRFKRMDRAFVVPPRVHYFRDGRQPRFEQRQPPHPRQP